MKREEPHYTDATRESCWLCAPGEPCHVHDPKMRKHLDGYDDERQMVWTVEADR